MLRLLAAERQAEGVAALYIDLLRIGSGTSVYSDADKSLPYRATTMLVDVLTAIHAGLHELVLLDDRFTEGLHLSGPALDDFADASVDVRVEGSIEVETSEAESTEIDRTSGLGLRAGPSAVGVSASDAQRRSAKSASSRRRQERGKETYRLIFGRIATALGKLVQSLNGAALWLLLDEWSSLPLELQPYLGDLLRRNVFKVHGVTVKIGAIDRRSRFIIPGRHGDYVGMELGSDTATTINIDDYLTFDSEKIEGRSHAELFFSEVLFRHARTFLARRNEEPLFPSADYFLHVAFAEGAFSRLVEVSEGVPRDALQIAQLAASKAVDRPITVSNVNNASSEYCYRQKEGRLSRRASIVLNTVIEQCAQAECRTIALRRDTQASADVVAELYDQRLLHRRRQGVAGLDGRPLTEKYDLFLVDLGSFMDLINNGQLRLIDHGVRDRGIARMTRTALLEGTRRKAPYIFVNW